MKKNDFRLQKQVSHLLRQESHLLCQTTATCVNSTFNRKQFNPLTGNVVNAVHHARVINREIRMAQVLQSNLFLDHLYVAV